MFFLMHKKVLNPPPFFWPLQKKFLTQFFLSIFIILTHEKKFWTVSTKTSFGPPPIFFFDLQLLLYFSWSKCFFFGWCPPDPRWPIGRCKWSAQPPQCYMHCPHLLPPPPAATSQSVEKITSRDKRMRQSHNRLETHKLTSPDLFFLWIENI